MATTDGERVSTHGRLTGLAVCSSEFVLTTLAQHVDRHSGELLQQGFSDCFSAFHGQSALSRGARHGAFAGTTNQAVVGCIIAVLTVAVAACFWCLCWCICCCVLRMGADPSTPVSPSLALGWYERRLFKRHHTTSQSRPIQPEETDPVQEECRVLSHVRLVFRLKATGLRSLLSCESRRLQLCRHRASRE